MMTSSPVSLALFGALRKKPGSIFLSGQGLAAIAALLRRAATGETQRELALLVQALGDEPLPALLELRRRLQGRQGGVKLETATRIWLTSDANPEFDWPVEAIERGEFDPGQAERSASAINDWASKTTHGLIPSVIHAREIDALSKVILTDAISFEGAWAFPFDPERNRDQAFWVNGAATRLPMMLSFKDYEPSDQAQIRVYRGDGWDCAELPYHESPWRALFIKPEPGDDENTLLREFFEPEGRRRPPVTRVQLSELEARICKPDSFADLLERLAPPSALPVIQLPRFKVEDQLDLVPALSELGLRRIFSERDSELRALTGIDPTWIGLIRQRVAFELDELGTRAAAVTVALARAGGVPRLHIFRADQPFLVILYEAESREILFLGRFAPRPGEDAPIFQAEAPAEATKKGFWTRLFGG